MTGMAEQNCSNCKYSDPICGALRCMGQRFAPYVRPTDSCEGWKSKKQTNADRIRAMTDEELAELLRDIVVDSVRMIMFTHESRGIKEWLDWLKQEVSE